MASAVTEQYFALTTQSTGNFTRSGLHPTGGYVVGIDEAANTIVVCGSSENLKNEGIKVNLFTSPEACSYPAGTLMKTQTGDSILSVAVDLTTNTVFYRRANLLQSSAPPTPKLTGSAAVFFDFDGTLSVSMWVDRFGDYAVSDGGRKHIIAALSPLEVVDNFGGAQRLSDLRDFLGQLKLRGVSLVVVSHGMMQPIIQHLEAVQLLCFFDFIFASDSPELQMFGGGCDDKAKLIQSMLRQSGMDHQKSIFVEDSEANLRPAQDMGVCRTMLVGRSGLTRTGMDQIARIFGFIMFET